MGRLRKWFKRDHRYSWKEYWLDGRGDGFMKLPLLLLCVAGLLYVTSVICLILGTILS